MVHNLTLIQFLKGYREEVGAADVLWEGSSLQGTRFFVPAMGFQCMHTFCFRGGLEGVMNGLSARGPGSPPFLPMPNGLVLSLPRCQSPSIL